MRSFQKLGDAYHLRIESGADLAAVLELDEAHWIATTAPVSTLITDRVFLEFLDSDKDGRIRAEELKDGIRHLLTHLKEHDGIVENDWNLSLSTIDDNTEVGKKALSSADKVLKRLNASGDSVSLDQVRKVKSEVLQGGLDQAGVVLPGAAKQQEVQEFIEDIIGTVGGKPHPNGKTGVGKPNLDQFLTECQQYIRWHQEAGEIGASEITDILPLGKHTESAYNLFRSVEKKLIQYFLLCDIKRLNPAALERALDVPEVNAAVNIIDISHAESYLQNAPLALLDADGKLDLTGEVNPYFRRQIRQFKEQVVTPLLDSHTDVIDKTVLHELQDKFRPYVKWIERKPQVSVDNLTAEAAQQYVSDSLYNDSLTALIEESHRTAFVLENIRELEKLILYKGCLLPLVNSFVSFPKLYDAGQRALFEEGTLVMDGRHFTMAVKVDDREHHIETCKGSHIFVIYCELHGVDGKVSHEVAIPVTSGNRGNIHLNKWGIFNDVHGNELHARVVDLVENPISIGEAMADPFVRIGRKFFSHLEEFSSKAEERIFQKDGKAKEKKEKSAPSGGLIAGGGVALAAVGSSFAFMTKTLAGLTVQTVIVAVLVLAALIAIPAGISAYYKLSRRDLSTILEGSGWGINSRMKLSPQQATTFTFRPLRD